MLKLKLLKEDELYTRTQANRNLDISTNAFYKYYIDQMQMKEDFVTGKTKLYKGSTVNNISKLLDKKRTVPAYLKEAALQESHYEETGEYIEDLKTFMDE